MRIGRLDEMTKRTMRCALAISNRNVFQAVGDWASIGAPRTVVPWTKRRATERVVRLLDFELEAVIPAG